MDNQFETPVLFLIFNRPDTTQQVFNQIRQIKPKYLFVAADGPRSVRPEELSLCTETREIIQKVDWKCEVKTLFQDKNLGCGKAVSGAINWFFEQVEYGIILEDDCIPDLSFFPYCEELLIKYKYDEQVMHIGGNNFQKGIQRGEASYYFSFYPHIWGWATWRRAWEYYDYEMKDFYLTFNSGGIGHVFQNRNEKNYWRKIFIKTFKMQANTWDYQWAYTIWKNKGFSITPNVNLVINLGLNGDSSHTFLKDSFKNNLNLNVIPFPIKHPSLIVDYEADKTTFNNSFSHSINRLIRLFKENGISRITKYVIEKYIK